MSPDGGVRKVRASRSRNRWVEATLIATVATMQPDEAHAADARVWVVDDGSRIRREDVDTPISRGVGNPVWRPGAPARLTAFRDEVVALQVVIEPGSAELERVEVNLAPLAHRGDGAPLEAIDRFVEHYVEVKTRSRNEARPLEALGWSPSARPPDERVIGWVPDALVPVDLAASSTWIPYPMRVEQHTTAALWIDVRVPPAAAPGIYDGSLRISSAARELARITVEVDVRTPTLPYRAARFFAYYDVAELSGRIGSAAIAEPQLWRLLHAHHVDALATLDEPADARRLASALDGALFTDKAAYAGPGQGAAPGVASVGSYGALGAPTDEALARVRAIAPLVPAAVEDLILYAVDEQCDSARGPDWRRLLRRQLDLDRVRVAHTCSEDPRKQDVNVVLTAADDFDLRAAGAARGRGKRVWVYNGSLPRAGTLLLDADVTSLRASAWIAARYATDRWFLWEATFWNDDNKGGHGPIDPFATAESFHNRHGDSALGDGLLVYPGTQVGRFAEHSLGFAGVVPSMRLKNLRRGIQDAGIYALARAAHPREADAIVDELIPAALSDVARDAATPWPSEGARFAEARDRLRALVADSAVLSPSEVALALPRPAARRSRGLSYLTRAAMVFAAAVGAVAAGTIARRRRRR